MAPPAGPKKGVPANSENSFYFGVVGKDRAHAHFNDTYHASMQDSIPEDAFRSTMASINNHPDVQAWLHIVWDNSHRTGAQKMLHQVGTILTCGFLNLHMLNKEMAAEQKMNQVLTNAISTANSTLRSECRWTWVAPTSTSEAYIQIEDTHVGRAPVGIAPGHQAV